MTAYDNHQPTPKKRRLWQWLVLFGVGILIGLLIGRITGSPKQMEQTEPASEQTNKPAVMAVEAVRPTLLNVENSLSANGVVAPVEIAEVGSRISGVAVERVLVGVGEYVKAGQVLAVLDAQTFAQQVQSANAELAVALAAQEKARVDLARAEPLLQIDAVSRQEVDAYRTAVRQADARVVSAKANLQNASINQKRGHITAPVSGIVSAKHAQVGAVASGASLFSIIKNGVLEWQASVSPTDAQYIQIGQPVKVQIAGRVVIGQVTQFSPVADNSRNMTVHVRLPSNSGASVGMYQSGEFVFDSQAHTAVPISALLTQDGYSYVWLLQADEQGGYRTHRHQIQVLAQQGDKIAATLPEDALVVAQSVSFLNENDVVSIATIDGKAVESVTSQTNTTGEQ